MPRMDRSAAPECYNSPWAFLPGMVFTFTLSIGRGYQNRGISINTRFFETAACRRSRVTSSHSLETSPSWR